MMDWDRIDATIRQAYRHNGRPQEFERSAATPLTDLIAKDPTPNLAEMTESQLAEYAEAHHIAVVEGLSREELIEVIRGALETNWEERVRGMTGMLDYIFADGPHPLAVARRLYAIAKAIRPQCILQMSCAQLAVLCDDGKGRSSDGRATVSARIKRLYEEPLRRAGMHGSKAPYQKTESASAKYRESAQGNRNRLGADYLENNEEGKAA
ncbi:hypothetical protein BH20VER3_BH20VER3_00730 [soil metagenome]